MSEELKRVIMKTDNNEKSKRQIAWDNMLNHRPYKAADLSPETTDNNTQVSNKVLPDWYAKETSSEQWLIANKNDLAGKTIALVYTNEQDAELICKAVNAYNKPDFFPESPVPIPSREYIKECVNNYSKLLESNRELREALEKSQTLLCDFYPDKETSTPKERKRFRNVTDKNQTALNNSKSINNG